MGLLYYKKITLGGGKKKKNLFNSFLKFFELFDCLWIAMFSCFLVIISSDRIILSNAQAFFIDISEINVCFMIAIISSLFVTFSRFYEILLHAFSIRIKVDQFELVQQLFDNNSKPLIS